MNFAPNSPPKPSSYPHPHRPSYYPTNNGKYSRSPHHTARTPFNSHAQAYHPRLINTQSLAPAAATTSTATPRAQSTPIATQSTTISSQSTHNHIKKNYHFSAKSSELFIKKKPILSNHSTMSMPRNTRFDAMPAMPHPHVQLLTLTRPTISFSSQHTPQSFIANNNQSNTPNNSPHNTLSTVSTTSPNIICNMNMNGTNTNTNHNIDCNKNSVHTNRKSRWNTKPDHVSSNHDHKRDRDSHNHRDRGNRDRDRHRRDRSRDSQSQSQSRRRTCNTNNNNNKSHSRSRSRSRTLKKHHNLNHKQKTDSGEYGSDDIDMSDTDSFTSHNNTIHNSNKYTISNDIHIFPTNKHMKSNNNTKRNYAKEEIHRKQQRHRGCYTNELKHYMSRNNKRKRKKNIKHKNNCNRKPHNHNHTISEDSMADDENENDINDVHNTYEHNGMLNNYHIDINNSDFAIYEPPYKKPKFMRKVKAFMGAQQIPKCVMSKITKINNHLLIQRCKKRKQREEYIFVERAQSNHWNITPTKCWFYRCVHSLEGHVMTMCSSPDFCGGVSYPRKHLDEIEKKLARIHPLPPLIYKRLFKTLYNLSNLMRTYPNAVTWDRNKLQSIFEKAIRKQRQMKSIYNFDSDNCEFVEYDFTPFQLPEYERNSVSFYLNRNESVNENDNESDIIMNSNINGNINGIMGKDDSVDIIGIGMGALNRGRSGMSMTIDGGIDDDEEEENDEIDEGEEDQVCGVFGSTKSRSRSVTLSHSDMKDLTPALSLSSNANQIIFHQNMLHNQKNENDNAMQYENINKLPNNNNNINNNDNTVKTTVTVTTPAATTATPTPTATPRPCVVNTDNKRISDHLTMETYLNMDLVRKTKVTFKDLPMLNTDKNSNGTFMISPKIETLVTANCKKIELKMADKKRQQADIDLAKKTHNEIEMKEKEKKKITERGLFQRERVNYTWKIETLDSNDENMNNYQWLREKKTKLKDIFAHNGVYGPIKAIGLEPTYYKIPTYYQFDRQYIYNNNNHHLDEIRLPSIYYLIAKYVDSTNPWYIKMLIKYFDVQTYKKNSENINNENNNNNNNNNNMNETEITSRFIKQYLCKHPKSVRHTFIGTTQMREDKNKNEKKNSNIYIYSTIVMEIYINISNCEYYIRLRLNENKRHKLLCLLLRIKNKHRMKHHTICIPQPPPPKQIQMDNNNNKSDKSSHVNEYNKRISVMNTICVNYNWNGLCEATYCNKKHVCSGCGEKHPARICAKQCVDYNWAKCQRICPKNKQHICSQCGDNKHPAWRCQYLHKSVTERYYAIYKTKKLRNGYFKLLEKKEKKKNMEWINRRYKPVNSSSNVQYININNTYMNNNNRHQHTQQRHYYQNNKTKKRSRK